MDSVYFEYLIKRSKAGLLYRNYFLYPRLCAFLDGRVLDVGCGIGDMLRFRPNTIGVDINQKTVDWCCSQGIDARLIVDDVLPFEKNEFDGVILDNVLEHIQDPTAMLLEIRRIVRMGGMLIVGVPGRKGFSCDPDHKVFYDNNSMNSLMENYGFKQKAILYLPCRSRI